MDLWTNSKEGNIPAAHRVYVGGMGQGASIALNYAYSSVNIPAGAIALSGSLLPSSKLSNIRKMPSLVMHGLKDQMIR
jgi:predicted esterase